MIVDGYEVELRGFYADLYTSAKKLQTLKDKDQTPIVGESLYEWAKRRDVIRYVYATPVERKRGMRREISWA